MELKKYEKNNIHEVVLKFKDHKYIYVNKKEKGQFPFERGVEIPWMLDKVAQVDLPLDASVFDFGCNKAKYLRTIKDRYSARTFGIDIKKPGSRYADHFFLGEFNDKLSREIERSGPFDVATAISAIEHAGFHMNLEKDVRKYQLGIFEFLIKVSKVFLFSVPFGRRPGWAKDRSRKNLYQINPEMLREISKIAVSMGKTTLEEIYKLQDDVWSQSNIEAAADCIYRDKKAGASAVALVSIY